MTKILVMNELGEIEAEVTSAAHANQLCSKPNKTWFFKNSETEVVKSTDENATSRNSKTAR